MVKVPWVYLGFLSSRLWDPYRCRSADSLKIWHNSYIRWFLIERCAHVDWLRSTCIKKLKTRRLAYIVHFDIVCPKSTAQFYLVYLLFTNRQDCLDIQYLLNYQFYPGREWVPSSYPVSHPKMEKNTYVRVSSSFFDKDLIFFY